MFLFSKKQETDSHNPTSQQENSDSQTLKALWGALPMIEFEPDGTIIRANELLLGALGYRSDEVVGQHHKMFCEEAMRSSAEYSSFWQRLARGEFEQGLVKRVNKAGKILWLEATYVPVQDNAGRTVKVVKIAADVTQRVDRANELEGEMEAVGRSMAVIEFNPDGTIITANDNFLAATGYSKSELVGKHHRIFCEQSYSSSPEYKHLWQRLNNGEFFGGKIKRVDKAGNVKWLEATYNPIFDMNGKLCKIMKFASDITESVVSGQQTRDMAMETSQQAEEETTKGMQVVEKAIQAMQSVTAGLTEASESIGSLSDQSDQISNIVSTITAIADQTNLLALNAAIEAARAGEQGRGFAVVADEVRNLAARTSDSTAEIEDVVKRNTELATKAVGAMEQIVSQSHQGTELIQETGSAIKHISDSTCEMVNVISNFGTDDTEVR